MDECSDPRAFINLVLGELKSNERSAASRVRVSFKFLVSLYLRLGSSDVLEGEKEDFKAEFTRLISSDSNFMGLYFYLAACSDYAELGRLNGFHTACLMRSVLQIFNDHFIVWNEVGREDFHDNYIEEIADIDQTIVEVSDEAPPIREGDIPDWAPASHWWWRAPQQQDMSEAERKSRLEYDHWDGVED